MWAIFKVNVLFALKFHRFGNDMDGLAELFAKEYDACIKRGGDMMYGVPVINGNVVGMADAIKRAFRKGQQSDGENFNLLAEIYPSAFDAYWMGAEMAPYPNLILKPLGWSMTPPAPGAIRNIGPNPIMLGMSTARHKAEVSALQLLVDDLKNQTVNISPLGEVNVYETLQKVLKNEITDSKIKNHPAIKIAKGIINKHKQAKNKKPSIGTQFKKSIKFPFPNVFFVPPTYKFTNQSNILIDPFINVAKVHLLGVSGTISVMAQYPPPAPPAPSVIKWTGYTIKG